MNLAINCATEASDANFHLTRTSIYSFITNNPWFSGDIFLLTHKDLPLSDKNIKLLQIIYPNIRFLDLTNHTIFESIKNQFGKVNYLTQVNQLLKWAAFSQFEEKTLYFSNFSLFTKNISNFLDADSLVKSSNSPYLIYFNKKIDTSSLFLENSDKILISDQVDQILNLKFDSLFFPKLTNASYTLFSNSIHDSKYLAKHSEISAAHVILYKNLSNSKNNSKINHIWLYQNKVSVDFIESPKKIKVDLLSKKIEEEKIKKIPQLLDNQIDLNNQIERLHKIYENKIEDIDFSGNLIIGSGRSCLDYELGETIDSFQNITRFKGFHEFLDPKKIGLKTTDVCFNESLEGLSKMPELLTTQYLKLGIRKYYLAYNIRPKNIYYYLQFFRSNGATLNVISLEKINQIVSSYCNIKNIKYSKLVLTSGLRKILHSVFIQNKKTYVHGFDSLSLNEEYIQEPYHYYDSSDAFKNNMLRIHDLKMERNILINLIEDEKIFLLANCKTQEYAIH